MKKLIYDERIEFPGEIPAAVRVYKAAHYPAHYHNDALEIIICLEGSAELCACYESRHLTQGSIYSIDPMDPHYIYSDEDNLLLSFYIDITNLKTDEDLIRKCFFACEEIEMNDITIEAMYNIQDIITSVAFLLTGSGGQDSSPAGTVCSVREDRADCSDTVAEYTNRVMDYMIKYFDWLSFIPDPYYTNRNFRDRFLTIMDYCHENYREKISVSQLARMVHVNENYLSAFMKKTSFGGFKECINFIRCFMAENLLLTTDQNVVEISSICGFSDPKYFYAAFRTWWKCSPAQLRRKYREYGSLPADFEIYYNKKAFAALKEFMPYYSLQKLRDFR